MVDAGWSHALCVALRFARTVAGRRMAKARRDGQFRSVHTARRRKECGCPKIQEGTMFEPMEPASPKYELVSQTHRTGLPHSPLSVGPFRWQVRPPEHSW